MAVIQSSRDEDVLLDWEALESLDKGCFLVALTGKHIALLLSLVRYATWERRWVNQPDFDTVRQWVSEMEMCLMSGCNVEELLSVLQAGFEQQHEDMQALKTAIDGVATAQTGSGDLEDDLAMTWRQVEQVATILGAAVAEAPLPL